MGLPLTSLNSLQSGLGCIDSEGISLVISARKQRQVTSRGPHSPLMQIVKAVIRNSSLVSMDKSLSCALPRVSFHRCGLVLATCLSPIHLTCRKRRLTLLYGTTFSTHILEFSVITLVTSALARYNRWLFIANHTHSEPRQIYILEIM